MTTELVKDEALRFVETVRGHMKNTVQSYFRIGYELSKAQDKRLYKALGYDSLEDLSEDCFGFSKSMTYDIISLYEGCRKTYASCEMMDICKPYTFSQLVAMRRGRFATPISLIEGGRVKPTDSVRAISKYVVFFNKFTEENSGYPSKTLQEWLKEQEKAQALSDQAEQLSIQESENVQTSGLQPVAEEEADTNFSFGADVGTDEEDGLNECDQEDEDTTFVLPEIESKYKLTCRAGVREFMSDYENWPQSSGAWWFFVREYCFRNGHRIKAVFYETVKDIDNMETVRTVRYFLTLENGCPVEVTKEQLEKYIALHVDEL